MCYTQKKLTGFTLIELIVTVVIVAILASVAMPVIQLNVKRAKETELRANLRQIREAIDAYKKATEEGRVKKSIEQSGYPPNLLLLVTGIEDEKDVNKKKIKFLRRIPIDPMRTRNVEKAEDKSQEWGLRSYLSAPDKPLEGEDVYDVYSTSTEVGINGIAYAQW